MKKKLGVVFMISQNIKKFRKEKGLSQVVLGEMLGVGQSTVAMWECGKNSPEYATLLRLSELLEVSVSRLCGSEDEMVKVDVLGNVAAGQPIDALENIIGQEELSAERARGGDFFALRIKGRSMEPRMFEGDTVIVRRQNSVENGEIAIVRVGEDEATCKKVYRTDDGISLVSINPEYEPMRYPETELRNVKIEVLGKVCELRVHF